MLLNEFDNSQNIDEEKIICDKCQCNKSESYKKKFYKCNKCKMKLCYLCNSNHDESHEAINYENKNYICEDHNEKYISYCKTCNKNICSICLGNHNNHDIISYTELYKLFEKEKKIEEVKELKKKLIK